MTIAFPRDNTENVTHTLVPRPGGRLARFAREPLLHFVLLGSLVFASYRWVRPVDEDPRTIRISEEKRAEIASYYEQTHERRPSVRELDELVRQWVQSEILYREGLALRLDQNDATMREMVISKMRAVIQSRLVLEEPSEEELLAYYAEHRSEYDHPALVTLEQYIVSGTEENAEVLAKKAYEAASAGKPPDRPLMTLSEKSRAQLEMLFGGAFADAVLDTHDEAWHALRSPRGTHVYRVTARTAPKPVPFEQVREQVLHAFKNERKKGRYHEALERLRGTYQITHEGPKS